MLFAQNNVDRVDFVSEFDAQVLGYDYIKTMRQDFYDNLPADKFMPIWHASYGLDELERLASEYEVLGITQTEIGDRSLIPLLNSLVNRYSVRLHGVAITGRELMRQVAWDSVSSQSWRSPMEFGDTIIWIDKESTLKRYPRRYKSSRKQHRILIQDAGFDSDKIENDDSGELLRLSLWSWQQFVAHLNKSVTTQTRNETVNFPETPSTQVDTQDSENRNAELLPRVTKMRPTELIPLVGIRPGDTEETEEQRFVYKRSDSMRLCNTCFLRAKCPGFQADANCAYNIPIEIKTKEQLANLQASLLEMQAQRVLFMQMAEDLEGGYADPNLSSEFDRMTRMIKTFKEADREGSYLKIEASSTNAGPGFLEKHFGKIAADKALAIEPVEADKMISESEIMEAELVEG